MTNFSNKKLAIPELIYRANKITIRGLAVANPYIVLQTNTNIFGEWDNEGTKTMIPYDKLTLVKYFAKKYGKQIRIHNYDRRVINKYLNENLPETIEL